MKVHVSRAPVALALVLALAACPAPDPEIDPACRELPWEERPLVEPQLEVRALVLHDSSGPWGDLGAIYGTMVVNLLGHFPEVNARLLPVSRYTEGDLFEHDVTFYVGVVYGELLPDRLERDFAASERPFVWIGQNLWQVALDPEQDFRRRYGLEYQGVAGNSGQGADTTFFSTVHYQGERLHKYFHHDPATGAVENDPDVTLLEVLDPERVEVVAEIEHSGTGERVPYVVRSGNLWYVADNPMTYLHEVDRYLVFTDLMHDFVGLDHEPSRRALFRLEDVHPWVAPETLEQVIEVVDGRPWNLALTPVFADPLGVYNDEAEWHFDLNDPQASLLREQIAAARASGAEITLHGYTHQLGRTPNPYNGVTGTDYEFWNAVDNEPIPGDSYDWAYGRVSDAVAVLEQAGLAAWAFEVPHYQASMVDYFAFADLFGTIYNQGIYTEYSFELDGRVYGPNDVLSGGAADLDMAHADFSALSLYSESQIYPYPVERDVYGQRVIPENLRNPTPAELAEVETDVWLVADMLDAAAANRVNRCGYASFFYHPFIIERPGDVDAGGAENLRRLIEGVEDLGYEFVQACALVPEEGIPIGE